MEAYVLDRHYKLWEEGNKLLKRVVFIAIVISLALIVKVLVPYVEDSVNKKPVQEKIESLKKQKDEAIEKIQIIEKAEGVLKDVNQIIEEQPWQREKQSLINKLAQMRNASPKDRQEEADKTISSIRNNLERDVINPIRESIPRDTEVEHRDLASLNSEINDLEAFIQQWESGHINKNWYRTLNRKNMEMESLRGDLNDRLNRFSDVVRQELESVKQKREAVNRELKSLNTEITAESDKLKDLEKELQNILPQWLRGLVQIEQVIQLLPLFLVGVAVYVFVIGAGLTRHFQTYARGKGLSETEANDPVMSSMWTLIPRGRFGTIQVILAYSLFFLAAWLMLEKAMDLLLVWLSIDSSHAWLGASTPWEVFLWLSRIGLLLLIAYVVAMPWRSKTPVTN